MTDPTVVAIGGGHGLSVVLEALVDRCASLTGVVSVADDGGSSGRLRRDLAIVAPGDMRRCLGALAPDGLARDALEHRFATGVLAGHPAGNVLLAAMLEIESDPVVVMDTLAAMVGARGRVLPATAEPVDLIATTDRGTVKGQVAVSESRTIDSIRYWPADPTVPSAVLTAIAEADAVIVGPGSLYTSVLAPVVPGVAAALAASQATVIYVANLAGEPEETAGYDLGDHIEAVVRHGIDPDVVVSDHSAVASDAWVGKVETFELTSGEPDMHDPHRLGLALASIISAG